MKNNQYDCIVALSIVLLSIGYNVQPAKSAHIAPPLNKHVARQLFLNELVAAGTEEAAANVAAANAAYYTEQMKKYHQQQLNYLGKWPSLRDLMLISDYDDNAIESNERLRTRLIGRLRQLGDTVDAGDLLSEDVRYFDAELGTGAAGGVDDVITTMPAKKFASSIVGSKLSAAVKDHSIKKNVQYMSPCHFKICNMGRKRNADTTTNTQQY